MINILNQLRIKGSICKLIKGIYKKSIVNIFNSERLNDFCLKSGKINELLFLEFLFNIALEVLISITKQEGEKKHINWEEKSKTVLIQR